MARCCCPLSGKKYFWMTLPKKPFLHWRILSCDSDLVITTGKATTTATAIFLPKHKENSDNNGKEATVNRALDGSTHPG